MLIFSHSWLELRLHANLCPFCVRFYFCDFWIFVCILALWEITYLGKLQFSWPVLCYVCSCFPLYISFVDECILIFCIIIYLHLHHCHHESNQIIIRTSWKIRFTSKRKKNRIRTSDTCSQAAKHVKHSKHWKDVMAFIVKQTEGKKWENKFEAAFQNHNKIT